MLRARSPERRLVTASQLAARDGTRPGAVWLAVCGEASARRGPTPPPLLLLTPCSLSRSASQVFDVTKGRKHYGPGGGYSFFSGKDGAAAGGWAPASLSLAPRTARH